MTADGKASQLGKFSITQSLLIDIIDVLSVSCARCDSEIVQQMLSNARLDSETVRCKSEDVGDRSDSTMSTDVTPEPNGVKENGSEEDNFSTVALVLYLVDCCLYAIGFVLNTVAAIGLLCGCKPILEKPFYSLILIYNIMSLLLTVSLVVDSALADVISIEAKATRLVLYCMQITTWFFTSGLVFLIGLNRMAIFLPDPLHSLFMSRRVIVCFSFLFLIASALVGIITSNVVGEVAKELHVVIVFPLSADTYAINVVDYFFGLLPALSTAFYVAIFIKIRSRQSRSVASSLVTTKAERSILIQGSLILICYLVPFAISFALKTGLRVGLPIEFETAIVIDDIMRSTTQVLFPLIVVVFSSELRKSLRGCHSKLQTALRIC